MGNTGGSCVFKRISETTEGVPAGVVRDKGREGGEEREVFSIVFKNSGAGVRDSG